MNEREKIREFYRIADATIKEGEKYSKDLIRRVLKKKPFQEVDAGPKENRARITSIRNIGARFRAELIASGLVLPCQEIKKRQKDVLHMEEEIKKIQSQIKDLTAKKNEIRSKINHRMEEP
jgi:peptidoglycan hydrolase CwlO-like protein